MDKEKPNTDRNRKGQFVKGSKAAGRTPIARGGKPNDPHNLRGLIAERAPAIIAAVAAEAERGDVAAANTLLRYVMPTLAAVQVQNDANQLPVMRIITSATVRALDEEKEKMTQETKETIKNAIKTVQAADNEN